MAISESVVGTIRMEFFRQQEKVSGLASEVENAEFSLSVKKGDLKRQREKLKELHSFLMENDPAFQKRSKKN